MVRGDTVGHSHVSLVSHLEATSELLRAWSARQALCDAGLFHSVYGTDAWTNAIATAGDRAIVQDLIGIEAESLVWLFGRCSQQSIVDSVALGGPLIDRIDRRHLSLADEQRRDLCELAVANWLEQRPRLDGEAQRQLLAAVRVVESWISPAARTAVRLASAVEADNQALRNWVSNSHRVITITVGGPPPILPSFEPEHVLACPEVIHVLFSIASWLRERGWNNTYEDHPAVRLALREPVLMKDLIGWLGMAGVDSLMAAGVLVGTDSHSGRITLAVGLLAMGDEIVVVPGDGKRRDGVYFGIEPLLLDMLSRAVAPDAARVLECGAGAGLASVLGARRATSIASDVLHRASAYVMLTRALNPHLRCRLHSVTADGAQAFRPSSFDLILANPPLVPGTNGKEQPIYAYGGPTGTELPIRLLLDTLPLLQTDGCLIVITLDSLLHNGRRPLGEALATLGDEYCWRKWISPWRFLAPNSTPRLLLNHRAVLADADHVGIAIVRNGNGGSQAAGKRMQAATAALSGSGWTPS
jgi:hypothetical protein